MEIALVAVDAEIRGGSQGINKATHDRGIGPGSAEMQRRVRARRRHAYDGCDVVLQPAQVLIAEECSGPSDLKVDHEIEATHCSEREKLSLWPGIAEEDTAQARLQHSGATLKAGRKFMHSNVFQTSVDDRFESATSCR